MKHRKHTIDDVLRQWRRSQDRRPLPFFVRDLQPRQLALLWRA